MDEVGPLHRDDIVAACQCQAGEVAKEVRQPSQLRARFVDGSPVVEGLQLIETVQIALERIGQTIDEARAFSYVESAPFAPLERLACTPSVTTIVWRQEWAASPRSRSSSAST